MKPVRIAVIGCGVIGNHHLRHAADSDTLEVVAVCDLREQAAREAADKYGVEQVCTDAEEVFASEDVEAVVLAMPTCHRTPLGLRALRSGKHLLTEKPVAMNADEVRHLIAARGELVAACCSSRMRFNPTAQAAAEFVARGELGEIRLVHCRVLVAAQEPPAKIPPEWRVSKRLNGGGILVNWGCYDLDYLLGILGWNLEPETAFAQCWPLPAHLRSRVHPNSDAENHVAALVRCRGGAALSYERAEFAPCGSEQAWSIMGERGTLHLQMLEWKESELVFDRTTDERGAVREVVWSGNGDSAAMHSGSITDFAAAIRDDRPPATTLENALLVQRITDAIYASAESGAAEPVR